MRKAMKRIGYILNQSKGRIIKKIGYILEAVDHYIDLLGRMKDVEGSMRLLQRQLTSLQAIDEDWHTEGKIIIIAHVGGEDIIKIIPMRAKLTTVEYMEMAKRLELQYGGKPQYIDARMPGREWKRNYNERF